MESRVKMLRSTGDNAVTVRGYTWRLRAKTSLLPLLQKPGQAAFGHLSSLLLLPPASPPYSQAFEHADRVTIPHTTASCSDALRPRSRSLS